MENLNQRSSGAKYQRSSNGLKELFGRSIEYEYTILTLLHTASENENPYHWCLNAQITQEEYILTLST